MGETVPRDADLSKGRVFVKRLQKDSFHGF